MLIDKLTVATGMLAFVSVVPGLAAAQVPPSGAAQAIERGRQQFATQCAFCHGPEGTGASGPGLVTSVLVLQDSGGDRIRPLLSSGRPERGMPAFANLTDSQVNDLVAYLHTLATPTVPDMRVSGDPQAGRAYFEGPGKCSTCHSATGDLAGVGGKYRRVAELGARMLYPWRRSSPRQATVTLPSGATVSGTLQDLDEFTVAVIDSSGAYRSWPRENTKAVVVADPLKGHRDLLRQYSEDDIHNLIAYLVTLK